ncbi:methylmalonyl-CoA decarboxylase, delta subunit [Thermococcus kodakarensis KOD1]|uniref:Methylmalonyl-CoA decarboxylase, delta subunit n=1 Tax=Thermococcus kodakarensis (strain ATCC BAA-918 / JCM 12380 / KOD1) TaxID=69014 RepID=Q5JIS7_THEKO|nr:OadG family protein [Thermococcus kodakarensis]WCN27559.1 OadG family protein [Thermococcus kodakarensis]WCN29850.1 OadG family protein [Thermococcus kodakarensis]BAD85812.1 methylmalonyl-CoA decarboxylase, delta subunit [Thermococcus kodakarensis KOD1]
MDVKAVMEGLNITVIGVVVVFTILGILALVLYFVGWLERRLVEREKPATAPTPAPTPAPVEARQEEKPKIPPRDLAVITAAILAYTAEKASQLRPLPFRRKVSDSWRLYGLQTQMEDVEDFNYEIGKW